MLRSFFIWLSKAKWAQKLISNWKFSWVAASRFVAGEDIKSALDAIRDLNQRGINATLDHLGENTSTPDEAVKATEEIVGLLHSLANKDLRSNVSVKLTQIGLALDESLCRKNVEKILTIAKENDNFIRIDMEDTPYTDRTIRIFQDMKALGFDKVGLVIQSYLFRTQDDVRALLATGTRLRLVKGAYKEPAALAFPKKSDVDHNFDVIAKMMIDAALANGLPVLSDDGRVPPIPAFGTHDEKRIAFAKEYANSVGLGKGAIEFQMLFGIRRDLQEKLNREGYPVRIYVPYGSHWYPYFMRRLAERPANVWFFISNFFRK